MIHTVSPGLELEQEGGQPARVTGWHPHVGIDPACTILGLGVVASVLFVRFSCLDLDSGKSQVRAELEVGSLLNPMWDPGGNRIKALWELKASFPPMP